VLLVFLVVAVLLLTAAGVAAARAAGPAALRWSRRLRWAALAAAAVAAGVLAPAAARDSGRFAVVLLGIPVVLAAISAGWELLTGHPRAAVDWAAAILAMGWAMLLALGVGLAFVPAALLQIAAAATATGIGRTTRIGPTE
jgi:hypothetical protein